MQLAFPTSLHIRDVRIKVPERNSLLEHLIDLRRCPPSDLR